MHPRGVIFDLDGTLVDSLHDIGSAMNHALSTQGLPVHPLERYRQFVGDGVRLLVARATPADRPDAHETVLAAYRAYYAEHMLDNTRPFPGIREVLGRLMDLGLKMAVLSNKPDLATRRLVTALLPEVAFGAVHGERAGVPRKPDPTVALGMAAALGLAPGECAFVGDTGVDMGTARGAGMYGVGVTWGFRDDAELQAHGARALARTSDELLALLTGAHPARPFR